MFILRIHFTQVSLFIGMVGFKYLKTFTLILIRLLA